MDTAVFFDGDPKIVREAKRTCGACVVVEECLAYSYEHQIRDGIFGGMTPEERRRFRRKWRRVA